MGDVTDIGAKSGKATQPPSVRDAVLQQITDRGWVSAYPLDAALLFELADTVAETPSYAKAKLLGQIVELTRELEQRDRAAAAPADGESAPGAAVPEGATPRERFVSYLDPFIHPLAAGAAR